MRLADPRAFPTAPFDCVALPAPGSSAPTSTSLVRDDWPGSARARAVRGAAWAPVARPESRPSTSNPPSLRGPPPRLASPDRGSGASGVLASTTMSPLEGGVWRADRVAVFAVGAMVLVALLHGVRVAFVPSARSECVEVRRHGTPGGTRGRRRFGPVELRWAAVSPLWVGCVHSLAAASRLISLAASRVLRALRSGPSVLACSAMARHSLP